VKVEYSFQNESKNCMIENPSCYSSW